MAVARELVGFLSAALDPQETKTARARLSIIESLENWIGEGEGGSDGDPRHGLEDTRWGYATGGIFSLDPRS